MNKKDLKFILTMVFVTGYLFSFVYALIVDAIQSNLTTNIIWVWKNRHESYTVQNNMIHGAVLFLSMVVVWGIVLILDEIRNIKK